MVLSLLSPNRTVLLVTDEALYIYALSSKAVKLVESVPWGAENFVQNVSRVIADKCDKKPVLILNDMVEQHYRKEKVIKTKGGMMDKASIVKRKLNSTFPNYPVKAAYQLKEKVSKAPGQLPSDVYIFAAVPDTEQFNAIMDATKKSLASLSAFCLLPIESSDMVKTLAEKISKNNKSAAKWSVFVGQHKNGGLRQVVTKNGELALTRMSPIIDTDNDPKKWADQVSQEIRATMSYLSRFGYSSSDGLDLMVVANPQAGDVLNANIDQTDINFYAMTASEAAKSLNITIGPQEDERYADVLHVAWAGRKTRFILPMKASLVDEVSRPRQAAMVASILLGVGACFFVYQLSTTYSAYSQLQEDIEQTQRRQAQLNVQYQKEVQKKEELGFDVRLVQSSMAVYTKLEEQSIDLIPFLRSIGNALEQDMRLSSFTMERLEDSENIRNRIVRNVMQGEGASNKIPLFDSVLKMTYPSTTDIQRGNEEVNALAQRMRERLSEDYEVKVTKLLKDYEYTEGLIIETGRTKNQNLTQDFIAEITVSGPLKEGGDND